MSRRLIQLTAALSLILCAATVVLWIGFSDVGEDFFVATGGGTVWNFSSSGGVLGATRYSGWPRPVRVYHRTQGGYPYQVVSPIFAIEWAGAHRTEWKNGGFYFAHGTVCVMLGKDGTADYGRSTRSALQLLQNFTSQKFSARFRFWSVGIPCWLAVAIFALLPTFMIVRLAAGRVRGRLRTSRGRCCKCGYDLTGNTSGLCPECGSKISN